MSNFTPPGTKLNFHKKNCLLHVTGHYKKLAAFLLVSDFHREKKLQVQLTICDCAISTSCSLSSSATTASCPSPSASPPSSASSSLFSTPHRSSPTASLALIKQHNLEINILEYYHSDDIVQILYLKKKYSEKSRVGSLVGNGSLGPKPFFQIPP